MTQIQIIKAEIRNATGEVITHFSGVLKPDQSRDRDDIYGTVDDVLAVMRAVNEKGRGVALSWNDGNSQQTKSIVVRDANLRSKLIWAHVVTE